MQIKTFEQFQTASAPVQYAIHQLRQLNMKLTINNDIIFEFPEYVATEVAKAENDFLGITWGEKIALALACTEEDRNNHIDDSDIDFVNKFFSLELSRKDISKMHSKYI